MKKHNLNFVLIIFCIALFFVICPKDTLALDGSGNTYYISTQGNDSNPGTESSPWRTINKAANSLKAGDTVYIRGGVYKESKRIKINASGTKDNYITFTNYPGENVTIDGAGLNWGYKWDCLFDLNSKSYIKVIGLRVINSSMFGIGSTPDNNGCENIIIQNCSTYNTQGAGIIFFHGKNITIDGNSVEKACNGSSNTQECISLADIDSFRISNNHVFNCTNNIPGGGGEGIDVKNGCSNGEISNNTIHDLFKVSIYVDAYSKHQYNIEVYGNTVYNTPDGIAVATENGGLLENIKIHNNLIYNCDNWGFVVAGWGSKEMSHDMKKITFANNTIYNARDGGIHLNNSEAKNIVIINNIISTDSSRSASVPIFSNGTKLSETTINQNLLNRVAKGHPTGINYIIGDPKFSNPKQSDFSLKKNSPAVGKGFTSSPSNKSKLIAEV